MTALALAMVACCAIVAGCYLVTVGTVRAYLERQQQPPAAEEMAALRAELQRQRGQIETLNAHMAMGRM